MDASFVAFIPLSNWLRGFDRYGLRYSKARISESTYPDAFYLLREDDRWEPGLAKARRLIEKLGHRGDRVVALRAQLPAERVTPNDVTGTGIGWRWPSPEVPLSGVAWVDGERLVPTHHEEVTAEAFALAREHLASWDECRPRSFSVLPIARACPAKCAFCFSKASVSDLARQPSLPLETVWQWADEAQRRGAERAVITGGGEPTLLEFSRLCSLVQGLAQRFPKTLLITNGARLDAERLRALRDAGLTTLAVSRHGLDAEHDARVMGLAVDSAMVAREAAALGLRTRAICVVQRDGVRSVDDVVAYVQRSAREGFQEVCFKELYVSSLSENPWAPSAVNQFCVEHQVPLRVVLEGVQALGLTRVGELPWGSPVFAGQVEGREVKVAAYTEPSVGWERTNRLVRSWNLMADGQCLASLEDPHSSLSLRERGEGRGEGPTSRSVRDRGAAGDVQSVGAHHPPPTLDAVFTFEHFTAHRAELKRTRPDLLDLAETNLYRTLAPRFPPIAPSTHTEAPYRCHLAERFLDHLGLSRDLKPRTLISHGVRRSLSALFHYLAARGDEVAVPADVYPVYLQLAAEAKVPHVTWEQSPPLDRAQTRALLLCEPAKPWGTALTSDQTDALINWAHHAPGRLIIIDSAYATPPTRETMRLVNAGVGVLLASLSKGWLIPDHGGLCLAPEKLAPELRPYFQALPKDETKLRIAYAALTEHAGRPTEVNALLSRAAEQLDAFTRTRPELALTATHGYFAVSTRPADELLTHGVLALPASVFGSSRRDRSVVTSLHHLLLE